MSIKVIIYVCIGILAYLLGSVSNSIIFGKLRFKKDVRSQGSGNAGATNVARVFGLKFGFLVLFLDVAKAALATLGGYYIILLINSFYPLGADIELLQQTGKCVAGCCCVFGHCFPLYYKFKGGKAISVGLSAAIAVDWRVGCIALGTFILVFILSKIVSLSSVCAAATLAVSGTLFSIFVTPCVPDIVLSIFVGALAIFMHRENIQRLARGEEKRFIPKK